MSKKPADIKQQDWDAVEVPELTDDDLKRMRPASAKGTYMKGITINATMGPGVSLDPVSFSN